MDFKLNFVAWALLQQLFISYLKFSINQFKPRQPWFWIGSFWSIFIHWCDRSLHCRAKLDGDGDLVAARSFSRTYQIQITTCKMCLFVCEWKHTPRLQPILIAGACICITPYQASETNAHFCIQFNSL